MKNSSHQFASSVVCDADVISVPHEPESGVRVVGPNDDDPDSDRYDDDEEAPEGSFFGASDEAATNRVWGMFKRRQIRSGNGPDLAAEHARLYPAHERGAGRGQ